MDLAQIRDLIGSFGKNKTSTAISSLVATLSPNDMNRVEKTSPLILLFEAAELEGHLSQLRGAENRGRWLIDAEGWSRLYSDPARQAVPLDANPGRVHARPWAWEVVAPAGSDARPNWRRAMTPTMDATAERRCTALTHNHSECALRAVPGSSYCSRHERDAAIPGLLRAGLRPIPNYAPTPDGRRTCPDPECESPGKHPRLTTWKPYEHRSLTEEEVRAFLRKFPTANRGIVLGEAAGVICVDLDGEGAEHLL
jgi:hypothetical protein